jgi:hypothetical protein
LHGFSLNPPLQLAKSKSSFTDLNLNAFEEIAQAFQNFGLVLGLPYSDIITARSNIRINAATIKCVRGQ